VTPEEARAAAMELPGDIREAVIEMAEAHGVPLAWLLALYRRGYQARIGATGLHPYGPTGLDDEGELTVAMGVDTAHGVVRMVFGKKVGWLALPAGHARHLATMLVRAADTLDRGVS